MDAEDAGFFFSLRAFLFFFTGKRKESEKAHGTSRGEGFLETTLGTMKDDLVGALGVTADKDGYIDSEGNYQQRTCFTKGSLVDTGLGQRPIEEITIGDTVYAINEKTGVRSLKKVLKTHQRTASEIYKLVYENGSSVETTATHPFYIAGRGWTEARFLEAGNRSITKDNSTLGIKGIVIEKKTVTVYNFTVEEDHNYFVGQDGVLVHNVDYGAGEVKLGNEGYSRTLGDIAMDAGKSIWNSVTGLFRRETKTEIKATTAPYEKTILSGFYRNNGKKYHGAIDYDFGHGEDISAANDGKVTKVVNNCEAGDLKCGNGYGNQVRTVSNGKTNIYAHLDNTEVKRGDEIKKGQIIGTQGNTGKVESKLGAPAPDNTFGSHLHFEVRDAQNYQLHPVTGTRGKKK